MSPSSELTVMIRPLLRLSIPGKAARMHHQVPSRFVRSVACQCAGADVSVASENRIRRWSGGGRRSAKVIFGLSEKSLHPGARRRPTDTATASPPRSLAVATLLGAHLRSSVGEGEEASRLGDSAAQRPGDPTASAGDRDDLAHVPPRLRSPVIGPYHTVGSVNCQRDRVRFRSYVSRT